MHPWRQFAICREGWYYLFVLSFVVVGALLRDINLLVVVAGMLAGPLLFSLYSVLTMLQGVRVMRHLPRQLSAGDLLIVEVEVSNDKKRRASWAVSVVDRVRREGDKGPALAQPGILFPHVAAGQTNVRSYSGRIPRRGRYHFGPLLVSTRFPLGLMRRTVTWAAPASLVVYPRLGRLTPQWQRLHRQQVPVSQQSVHHRGANEGEFFGLRDYRVGDSRRRIHWRTSARRGALVVRLFEQPRNEDLLLIVDLWQPTRATPNQQDHVELAVSFAATVATAICRQGASRICVALGGSEKRSIVGTASAALLEEIMEQLALAAAQDEDQLAELLTVGLERAALGAPVVVVSTRAVELDQRLRQAVVPASLAGELSRRRVDVIDVSSERIDEFYTLE
jgi:uncharacterized protein (DUF58 family)